MRRKHNFFVWTYAAHSDRAEWKSGSIKSCSPENALRIARKTDPCNFQEIGGVCVYYAPDGEGGACLDMRQTPGGAWRRY